MAEVKASVAFLKETPESKVMTGEKIMNGITRNIASYPDLPIPLADLLKRNDTLQKTRVAAIGGDKASGYALKAANKAWVKDFRDTANYVSFAAKGNAELIADTGLKPTKGTRGKAQKITAIKDAQAKIGDGKGTFQITCASAGANGYIAIGAPEGVTVSMIGNTLVFDFNGIKVYAKADTKRSIQVDCAESSQPLYVYMFGFNSMGSSPLTDGQEVTPQ